jgi:hypothetical protein
MKVKKLIYEKFMPFQTNEFIKTLVTPTLHNPITSITADTYQGEYVNWTIGDEVSREFISNKINFYRANSNAIVFGNGKTRSKDLVDKIIKSNSKKIINYYNVLYGCNLAYKDFELDFLVITNKLLASKTPKEFHDRTYTRPEILRLYQDMNLIPINHNMDAGSTATMLACYHGANKVFLVGFDGCPENKINSVYAGEQFYPKENEEASDAKWQEDLGRVIAAYPKTKFYRVNVNPPNARKLSKYPNYKVIDLRSFVSLADI